MLSDRLQTLVSPIDDKRSSFPVVSELKGASRRQLIRKSPVTHLLNWGSRSSSWALATAPVTLLAVSARAARKFAPHRPGCTGTEAPGCREASASSPSVCIISSIVRSHLCRVTMQTETSWSHDLKIGLGGKGWQSKVNTLYLTRYYLRAATLQHSAD